MLGRSRTGHRLANCLPISHAKAPNDFLHRPYHCPTCASLLYLSFQLATSRSCEQLDGRDLKQDCGGTEVDCHHFMERKRREKHLSAHCVLELHCICPAANKGVVPTF